MNETRLSETEREALAPLTYDEASEVDHWMDEHMYRHSISNNINSMGCGVRCRTLALQAGVNKVILARAALSGDPGPEGSAT